jgi:hypothetical protein
VVSGGYYTGDPPLRWWRRSACRLTSRGAQLTWPRRPATSCATPASPVCGRRASRRVGDGVARSFCASIFHPPRCAQRPVTTSPLRGVSREESRLPAKPRADVPPTARAPKATVRNGGRQVRQALTPTPDDPSAGGRGPIRTCDHPEVQKLLHGACLLGVLGVMLVAGTAGCAAAMVLSSRRRRRRRCWGPSHWSRTGGPNRQASGVRVRRDTPRASAGSRASLRNGRSARATVTTAAVDTGLQPCQQVILPQ